MITYLPPLRSVCRRVFLLTFQFLLCVSVAKSQTFPDAPGAQTGSVTVTLIPGGIASGWHFVGEQLWRDSGTQVTGLVLGERQIEFRPAPNYIQPLNETVTLTGGSSHISLTREYYSTPGGTTGALTVNLLPDTIAAQSVPQATRAQWRLLGEGDSQWSNSGNSRNLPPGSYLIESKPVAGKVTPQPVSVRVLGNDSPTTTATYFVKDSATGTQPAALNFSTINNSNFPYAYVGQIRTHHSAGTGCVVLSNTVATAAHLIFDEVNLTYFGGLQWLFQRDPGTYEPIPQIPQRVGILTSYASQRISDNSPGQRSAIARNYDVAALYFTDSPGRNGYSDYEFSQATANEYLTSSNLKTLVCYPIEGISAANQGKMHATTPSNITFTANPEFPNSIANDTYSTTAITSSAGAAGAPIFVRNTGGSYDCVAIYLGGSPQTEVRSFTEAVDTLFFWANTNGQAPNGGVTQVDGPITGGGFIPGAIQINIEPSSGSWKLGSSPTSRASGATVSNLLAGTYTINFNPVAGYQTPAPISVLVSEGALATENANYVKSGPVTKITTPKNNATVNRFGFIVAGTAKDPSGIRKYQVKITGKASAFLSPGDLHFSGKVKGKNITIQMRAQNKAGVWGGYTTITVKAK